MITAASLIPGWDVLGAWRYAALAGAALTAAGLMLQHHEGRPVVFRFAASDWAPAHSDRDGAVEHELRIPYQRHGKRHPEVEVQVSDDHGILEPTWTDIRLDEHDVRVIIGTSPFTGQLIIR